MAGIRVISRSTIQARNQNGDLTLKIELTPWDLPFLLLESIQKGLLFHNPTSSEDKLTFIHHLKHSLSSTLDYFLPLAGRLIIVDHGDATSSVFVACNNAGASFVHAIAENATAADIRKPTYVPPIVDSFFPLNGAKNFEGTSNPMLAVQVTELVDGIFIGCSINHCLVDGTSYWHFFNSWAEISGVGLDHKLSNPPSLDRWFLDGIERPIRIPFSGKEKQEDSDGSSILQPLPERIFHFTREKIAELKAKANSEASKFTNKISSLQAVLSHVWRSVIRNQSLDPEEEVQYRILISARPRIRPPIPENYFGNALSFGAISMKAGELLDSGGLGKFPLEMNKIISLHTDDKFKRDFESWVKNPCLYRIRGITGKALGTSSSPRFNFYGNDFGWGRPVAVRSGASNKKIGNLTVYGGAEEGSLDIELCISHEILEGMGRDPEFMAAVSISNGSVHINE